MTKGIDLLNLVSPEDCEKAETLEENVGANSDCASMDPGAAKDIKNETLEISELSLRESKLEKVRADGSHKEHQMLDGDFGLLKKGIVDNRVLPIDAYSETVTAKSESSAAHSEDCDMNIDDCLGNKQVVERRFPNAVLPLLRYYQYESSESSSRYISLGQCIM